MSKIMKTITRKDTTTAEKKGLDIQIKRSVQGSKYSFAKAGVVAPDKYDSSIAGVEVTRTKGGEDAVDILYNLTNQEGKTFHVRMRYPLGSFYFEELCDALLEAGLKEGMDIKKAVGIEEEVTIDYVNGERIGSIVERVPVGSKSTETKTANADKDEADDDDDEFDFADDEEDDLEDDD